MKNNILQPKQLVLPSQNVVRQEQQTGPLPLCDLLSEINKLNDKSLIALLGKLDFNTINIQYYNVDIVDALSGNNVLTFYSDAGFYGNDAVEIKMLIKQHINNIEKTVVKGDFIYSIKNLKHEKIIHQFSKLINNANYGIKTWGRSTRL